MFDLNVNCLTLSLFIVFYEYIIKYVGYLCMLSNSTLGIENKVAYNALFPVYKSFQRIYFGDVVRSGPNSTHCVQCLSSINKTIYQIY